jgi:hypothetical protein
VDSDSRGCQRQFDFLDSDKEAGSRNLYYRVEANAPDELPAFSEIRSYSAMQPEDKKAYFAELPGQPSQFILIGSGVKADEMKLISLDGRTLLSALSLEDGILSLENQPKGLYWIEFVQNDFKLRQRISLR